MRVDPTAEQFIPSDQGEIYFPWSANLLVGAPWAFVVSTEATRLSLGRFIRIRFWITVGLSVPNYLLAGWLHSFALFCTIALIQWLIYYALVMRRVQGLERIPVGEALLVLVRHRGDDGLRRIQISGYFCVVGACFCLVLSSRDLSLLSFLYVALFAALFGANAAMASHFLSRLRLERKERTRLKT